MTTHRPVEPLRGSYERLQLLLDNLPAMVGYWDRELRNRFGNQAYLEWFGFTPEGMLDRHIREILGEKLFALNHPFMESALKGKTQYFEREIIDARGVQRLSQAYYIPDVVKDEVQGFFVLVVDISHRRALEDALQRELAQARQLAAAQAAQARAEGESAQLRALVEERDQMLREREEVLWFLTHEVRQPLHNASAALQAVLAWKEQPHQPAMRDAAPHPEPGAPCDAAPEVPRGLEPLAQAEQVLRHVIDAVNNNLAAASLLASGRQASVVDVDLAFLVELVLHDINSSQRHRVVVDSRCAARTVQLEPGLIRMALCNLIGNALQYSPADQPVRLLIEDSDEPLALTFKVIDRGSGIPLALQNSLFERGVRGSNVRSVTGAGLGLYLVRQIVRLHGGSIEIGDAQPRGAVVRMTLPQGMAT
ncbi:MAG: ATP-binding protein [Burkholderiales bacterium]